MQRASLVGILAAAAVAAGPGSPQLSGVSPRGVQRGTEAVLVLSGARLSDPQELHFYDPGISVVKLESPNAGEVRATIQIAPDARLGETRLRLRTLNGWTEMRTVFVGALPALAEQEPNGAFDKPQKIPVNVTIDGVVTNEDVDYYLVEAKKGQRLSAEVEGIRLGLTLFDPYVAILDMKRFEIAASDDTALLQQDPSVSVTIPEDGTYVVMVRESAYGGSDACRYRLHVGDFPRPTAVYPAGGKAGETLAVTFLGDPSGPIADNVTLPTVESYVLHRAFCRQGEATAPSANLMRVSDFPNLLEREPNDALAQATAAEGPLPLAFNGVIQSVGDQDWFLFSAAKGQVIDFRAFARTLRTPLDPVIQVFDEKGTYLNGNDDSGGPDAYVRIQFPADGKYALRVLDHLNRGGPDFVYRVEATVPKPRLSLSIPHVARNDSQSRQWAAVPRGNRAMVLVQAGRGDFGGDLKFAGEGMPDGVTLHAPVMSAGVAQAPLVFEAAPDAPIGGKLCDLVGRHVDDGTGIRGRFFQAVELVQGPPNNTPYYVSTVDRFAVAVIDAAPFSVRLEAPKVPLLRDGQMRLKVVAQRADGFDAPITVSLPFVPPGVGTSAQEVIQKGQTEVLYPLSANGGAAVGAWQIAINAWADVGGGLVFVSSPLTPLEVAPHLVTGAITLAVTEQGQPAAVVCKLTPGTPFDEAAELTLYGLPNECTTKPASINKETKEVVFEVATTDKSPVGQHRSLFCQVALTRNGEPMVQSLAGGGVLRIDKPRPAPTAAAAPAAQPAPQQPKPAEPKRLSRLEQLRLEAAEKAKKNE
jgi:hypothetical protein